MSDVISMTASELGAAIRAGEVTSEEATTAYLDRIEAVDGDINAFLHVRRETALAQARDVDARLARGEELGPLAGVPRSEERRVGKECRSRWSPGQSQKQRENTKEKTLR